MINSLFSKPRYLFIAAFLFTAVYVLVFGESGFLRRIELARKKDRLLSELAQLQFEQKRLTESLARYRRGEYPIKDLVYSGYLAGGDRLVLMQGVPEPRPKESSETGGMYSIPLSYMRGACIAIGAVSMILIAVWGRLRARGTNDTSPRRLRTTDNED